MWYRALRFVIRALSLAVWGYRLHGGQHLPAHGGVLLSASHQSFLDPVLYGLGLSRPFHFMARSSLFRNPLFGLLIRSLNAFPVRRGEIDHHAIRETIRLLEAGHVVLVFPEGTRTSDGSIGRPRGGLGMIAARAGVPIVPAIVEGAFESWPRQRRFPRLRRIAVSVGRPVPPAELAGLSHDQVAAVLHQRMIELQTDLRRRRGEPPVSATGATPGDNRLA